MRRILYMLLDAGIAGLILLPLFWYLSRRYFQNRWKTVWYYLLAVYLCGVYAVVGLPDICYIRLDLHMNLVPFAYMFSDYKNSLLNVALFVPLGFFLTVLWKKFRCIGWTALFGLGMSLLIELLQIFTFRATDVNDLMTNTTGCILGWGLGELFGRIFPKVLPEENWQQIFGICGISFGVMFFLQPLVANLLF